VDGFDTLLKLRMACLVGLAWMFAVLIPPAAVGLLPGPGWQLWALMAFIYAYLGYTGIRAYRRRWRSRFILRIVVPLSILGVSAVATAVVRWTAATA
jgi:hypothetical protein